MVVHRSDELTSDERIDLLFHALADATRRDIVKVTLRGDYSVSALAERYPMSFAAVQKHVAVLERAQLVTKRKAGREQLVSGNIRAIRRAEKLLEHFEKLWIGRVERMDDILREGE